MLVSFANALIIIYALIITYVRIYARYRETIRFGVRNSFIATFCSPVGNSKYIDGPPDLPSIIRHIEFYGWIGVR